MGIINFVLYDYINNPCRVADGREKINGRNQN